MAIGLTLNQFALFVTLTFAWWRLVRFTRTSRDRAIKRLEDEFWINHSLDLEIPAGQTEHERDYGDKQMTIRGLEIREHRWWIDGDLYRGTEYEDWKHRLRAYYRISKRHLKKAQYYIWRNVRPFAGLDLECTFLVETENCRIATMEEETVHEYGRELSGRTLTEVFPEISSALQVEQNIDKSNLYRVTLTIHNPYKAIEVFSQLSWSKFMKESRFTVDDGEVEETESQ